mmetsp:Transcript_31021/g.97877  ORF Transcript_31021/g.97877 Transcript_31021/m.97877 type:complete len:121 (+) Transcript_31021:2163-2525(+)
MPWVLSSARSPTAREPAAGGAPDLPRHSRQSPFPPPCEGAHEFDVILMDCDMPVMNGFEATAQIRRIEREQNVAKPVTIWALTAHAMNSVKAQCLECGMDAFLTKPLMLPVLRERLESLA